MPKKTDYEVRNDVVTIMETMIDKFPGVFSGFDTTKIQGVHLPDTFKQKKPITLKSVRFPYNVRDDMVYYVVVADGTWNEMNQKQRNLAVFHTMCSVPEGAFDPESKNYARVRKPDYELFAEEYAVCGTVDWMTNEDAIDPLDAEAEEDVEREPVTAASVATVDMNSEEE